jgi:hypothetical protein
MKTRVFGEQKDKVVIETEGRDATKIPAANSIVKLWFSDGTILGIKYGKDSLMYPNIWHIRIINQGREKYIYRQCFQETLLYYSDVYETEAEWLRYEVIHRSTYKGDIKA